MNSEGSAMFVQRSTASIRFRCLLSGQPLRFVFDVCPAVARFDIWVTAVSRFAPLYSGRPLALHASVVSSMSASHSCSSVRETRS